MMYENPYLNHTTPEQAMANVSGNPLIEFLASYFAKTQPPAAARLTPVPSKMAETKGPIAAKKPKQIAKKRSDIMKKIP